MVHVSPVGKFHSVLFNRSLFKFLKGFLHLNAVISLRFIFANLDAVIFYKEAIF